MPVLVDRPAPVDTMISVGDHRLHFRLWGGTGDVAVLFHAGGGSDLSAWKTVPALLAEKTPLRIVAYDRAGLGGSELGPRSLTPFDEIGHLDDALDAIGVRRVILVGHSYGGLLSLYQAARDPSRVVGLVLVDPMNPVFVEKVTLAWLSTTVPDIKDPKTPREIVITRMKSTMGALVDSSGKTWPAIKVPTVVITAGILWFGKPAIDSAWRQSHETLSRGAPPREIVVAAKSKHGIPETEPELVVSAIERVIGQAGVAPRR